MLDQAIVVRSQLIPLENQRLVLPNTAIAEVIGYSQPQRNNKDPDWFLGFVQWRGLSIPVISFEVMTGSVAVTMTKRARIIVLNGVSGDNSLPFYGFAAQGIPRLMSMDSSNLHDSIDQGDNNQYIARRVIIDGQAALIPDQKEIEKQLSRFKVKSA